MPRPLGTRGLDLARQLPPGLEHIPHQLGSFAEFRQALLRTAMSDPRLADWQPTRDDPGLLLLELWAYVADIVSRYEEQVANEAYVSTATGGASLEGLVALLGYVPRPAIAHRATLVVDASENLVVPRGYAVVSQAIPGASPQTFEVTRSTAVRRDARRQRIIGGIRHDGADGAVKTTRSLLTIARTLTLRRGDRAVVKSDTSASAARVVDVRRERDASRRRLMRVTLDRDVSYRSLASVELLRPQREAIVSVEEGGVLDLEHLYAELGAGDALVVGDRVTAIVGSATATRRKKTGQQVVDDETTEFFADFPFTRLTTAAESLAGVTRVGYDLRIAGEVVAPVATTVSGEDELVGVMAPVHDEPFFGVLRDRDGVVHQGWLEAVGDVVQPLEALPALRAPVDLFTATVEATQGASHEEVLGEGSGSPDQVFTLQRGPLTYLNGRTTQTAHGFPSTLRVWVDGVEWRQVPSPYGLDRAPTGERRAFHVRERPDGKSDVIFGGLAVPSGAVVRARYRFGAGGPAVAAGHLDRPSTPLAGLEAIFNVAPPSGGGDAEPPEVMRTSGPRSTLALGRIVSLADLVAEAQRLPGTVVATARWTWDRVSQRAAAVVWFVGAELDAPALHRHLHDLADPELRLSVRAAVPHPRNLSLDVEVAATLDPAPVEAALAEALVGTGGYLRPEQLGVGRPLVRSGLLARIYGVDGVARVRHLTLGGLRWDAPAEPVDEGGWLDFVERGQVLINGREVTGG